ncbi:efflux RND transporter periplasmic adaptor subunit [Pseudoruegeria sp. SK021]|uniref:efflux RND transporter periplasmic adaptor subunit n=1 Tax=Pseudoruegeria sp. SK021 TaxID=1933035 RepID=UPI000A25B209|nr:efflux RND transporter periplasmic adaptor subunit [Pseudoruegeria sp. SK021]OSP56132.1 efflux transporter periplasmic adaptor subunit [Pseudoruegeria sp. SK021]
MFKFFGQLLIAVGIVAATLAIWVAFVPGAMPVLHKYGVADLLGLEDVAEDGAGQGGGPRRGGGAVSVITAAVQGAVLNDRVTAIGDGRALRSVAVRSEADGLITGLYFASGARVEEGDVILRLADEAQVIAFERARLVLADAKDELDRFTRLQGAGTVSGVQFRAAQLALETAELAVREAQYDLDERTVRAPISGWIGLLTVGEGDRLSSATEIAVIDDRSQILIDFRVPDRFVRSIRPGTPIQATPLFDPSLTLDGEVRAVDNQIDRASRTLSVEARIDNEGDSLRAGMAFSIAMEFEGDRYPAIDPLALQWSSEGSFVWAVRDDKAVRVPVVIRQRNSDSLLIEADLHEGDLVVTEGVQTLRPGSEVRIANAPTAQADGVAKAKSENDT